MNWVNLPHSHLTNWVNLSHPHLTNWNFKENFGIFSRRFLRQPMHFRINQIFVFIWVPGINHRHRISRICISRIKFHGLDRSGLCGVDCITQWHIFYIKFIHLFIHFIIMLLIFVVPYYGTNQKSSSDDNISWHIYMYNMAADLSSEFSDYDYPTMKSFHTPNTHTEQCVHYTPEILV